jgi:nitrate reductase gamma subunit
MDTWLEVAKGPLFAAALLVMLIGLGRHILLQIAALLVHKRKRLRYVKWGQIVSDSLTWAVPIRHLIPGTVIFSISSFLFHIGVIVVPLFLVDHIVLWEGFFKVSLPAISYPVADFLTIVTIVCILILFTLRILIGRLRAMSRTSDYVLLLMILLPFASGFMASHPMWNPLPWKTMMLLHFLSADALLLVIPFTKLAHIVLYPFDRISQVHWQLRPGAGDKVAEALFGEEVNI